MNGLTINISWEYFLGVMAALIGIAWYSGSRFTALETSMKWVKEILNELKIASDNENTPTFGSQSPVNLNKTGEDWLKSSGMKDYIDLNKDTLVKTYEEKKSTNPYEVQKEVFRNFDIMDFPPDIENLLKKFAFERGSTMNIIRRIGAIYFRNICIESFGMNKSEIDKHDPNKQT